MLKYEIKASTNVRDGFSVKIQADTNEDREVAEKLTKALIEKIEKISVEIKAGEEMY